MDHIKVMGIDLGATNVRGAVVIDKELSPIVGKRIRANGSVEDVLEDIYEIVDQLLEQNGAVQAIGIGVPSICDVELGIVYNVLNIPSWKEVHLKKAMQERYNLPVYVNNDANCFAVGEYYFGKGQGHKSMIGLIMGTGLGAGIIINSHLYSGFNCGAGELGFIPYGETMLEYHATGSFFNVTKGVDGEATFKKATQGDAGALALFREMGTAVGYTIKMIMYTYDPELIVLGGSARHGYDFFQETMWAEINTLAFPKSIERIKIERSELHNSAIIGAAALFLDSQ